MSESSEQKSDFYASSFPKEKWLNFALQKLRRGFVLIVNEEKPIANLYKQGTGYDPCPFRTAKFLIHEGLVVPQGIHHLGKRYILSDDDLLFPIVNKAIETDEPIDRDLHDELEDRSVSLDTDEPIPED